MTRNSRWEKSSDPDGGSGIDSNFLAHVYLSKCWENNSGTDSERVFGEHDI